MNNLSDHPPVIYWNKDHFLSWDDFKGVPDPKIMASARSSVGFETDPSIETIATKTKTKLRIKSLQIKAIFTPNLSWVIAERVSEKGSLPLLRHEQGHFDLAEEISRKSNLDFENELSMKTFSIDGKTDDEKILKARKYIIKISDDFAVILKKKLDDEELKYDRETNHGRIPEKQQEYNTRFEKLRLI